VLLSLWLYLHVFACILLCLLGLRGYRGLVGSGWITFVASFDSVLARGFCSGCGTLEEIGFVAGQRFSADRSIWSKLSAPVASPQHDVHTLEFYWCSKISSPRGILFWATALVERLPGHLSAQGHLIKCLSRHFCAQWL
jgi:hypothetical protein